jgi:hypothetical protein
MEMGNLPTAPVLYCLRQLDLDQLRIALQVSLSFPRHSLPSKVTEGTQAICSNSMHFTVVRREASMVGLELAVTKLPARLIRAANMADMVKALAVIVTMEITSSVVDGATIMDTNGCPNICDCHTPRISRNNRV